MNHQQLQAKIKCGKPDRSGTVALVLVLILALLVGTFSASVTRRAYHQRRAELHHHTTAMLQSAIDAVVESGLDTQAAIRLPLDDSPATSNTGRWILIETTSQPSETQQYQATLYHNNQPGVSIRRSLGSNP